MAPAARPVAAVPFRKLRRDVEWSCGLPRSHSVHMMSSPTAVWLPAAVAAAFANVLTEWSNQRVQSVNGMMREAGGGSAKAGRLSGRRGDDGSCRRGSVIHALVARIPTVAVAYAAVRISDTRFAQRRRVGRRRGRALERRSPNDERWAGRPGSGLPEHRCRARRAPAAWRRGRLERLGHDVRLLRMASVEPGGADRRASSLRLVLPHGSPDRRGLRPKRPCHGRLPGTHADARVAR